MSLVAFAIRVSLVKMLRGATLAGKEVYDSPLDPVPQALAAKSPLIHVYSESETLKTDKERTLLQGERSVNVTLQVFLPVEETIATGALTFKPSTRRGGGQAILDVMYRQIEAALVGNDGVWHDLYRRFVDNYRTVSIRPYVIQTDKGVRLTAREVELICDTQNSPAFGPMSDLWTDFVAAMQGDADLKPLAGLMTEQITGDVTLTQPQIDAILLGYTTSEAEAVLVYPPEDPSIAVEASDDEIEVSADPDAPVTDGD